MNAQRLIIPIGKSAAEALENLVGLAEHSEHRKASKLANLINRRMIGQAGGETMGGLRSGRLNHRPLSVFREHIQRMFQYRASNESLVLVDPLFALTLQAWISSLDVAQIVIVHDGRETLDEELKETTGYSAQCCKEMSDNLISDILAIVPRQSQAIVANLSVINVPTFLDQDWAPDSSVDSFDWNGVNLVRANFDAPPNTSVGWTAYELLHQSIPKDGNDSEESLIDECRLIEIQALDAIASVASDNDQSKLYGEYFEPKVRPIGRRIRYALQMIFQGKIRWKYTKGR